MRVLRRPRLRLRRHPHDARPRRGDARRRRAALHAEPAHVAADEPRSRELRGVQASAARSSASRPAASSRTRSTSSTSPRRTTRSTRSRAPRCGTRWRSPARSTPTASSSTSARTSAPGIEAGMKRCVPAIKEALELCTDTTWLLMEDSAGAGGTIGRSIDELAQLFDACDGHERLGICLDTCHLFVSGVDITEARRRRRAARRARRRASVSTACARCTSTTRATRSARTATATRTSARACSAASSASSSRIRSSRACPRSSRCPARTTTGPTRTSSGRCAGCTSAGAELPLADPRRGDARVDEPRPRCRSGSARSRPRCARTTG